MKPNIELERCTEALNRYTSKQLPPQVCGVCNQPTIVIDIRPTDESNGTVGWKCTNCGKLDGPRN